MVRRKDLKAEISAAVFASKPPQLIKPIVTANGVHLIWVEEIVQAELDEKLRLKILSDLFNSWIEKKIYRIEVMMHWESNNSTL